MLGDDQPSSCSSSRSPPRSKALKGVVMELDDCAFPLLAGDRASATTPMRPSEDADFALLVGARPRTGMERGDLLRPTARIFKPRARPSPKRRPRHEGARRGQPRQHQRADRHEQRAQHPAERSRP